MSIFGFRGGPSYRAATRQEQFMAALEMPMNPLATFFDQAKGGALESFGLGTVIRDFSIPQGTQPREVGNPYGALDIGPITTAQRAYEAIRGIVNPVQVDATPMTQDEWKSSPYFRSDIPWDEGMTADRAAALAAWDDARKVREFYAQKRPIISFLGGFAGQAADPINYIPVAGPAVKAAAVARAGRVGGTAVAGAVDAAANTALFGIGTIGARREYGDNVSWQAMVSEIAMAAAIGGAFGGVGGAIGRRRAAKVVQGARERLSTLENTQQARVALNEALDGMATAERIELSPNGLDAVTRLAPDPADVPPSVRERFADADDGLERDIVALQKGSATQTTAPRKPVIETLKRMGGIDPDSPVAEELRAIGVTSRTAPGLFRRNARRTATPQGVVEAQPLRDLDNIPVSEVPDRFGGLDDGNGYVPRQVWLDAIADEMAGTPRLTPDEQRAVDETQRPLRELDEFMSRWGIEYREVDPAEAAQQVRVLRETLAAGVRVDPSNPRPPEGLSEEGRLEWESAFRSRTEKYAETYRINPETGDYLEADEIDQVRTEGRLTEDDEALLSEQDELFNQSAAYGKALDAAVACLI